MFVILKNGFRYSGKKINETKEKLLIEDVKLGLMEIDKDSIAARGGEQ